MTRVLNKENRDRMVACLTQEAQEQGSDHFSIHSYLFVCVSGKYRRRVVNSFDTGFNDINALHQCGSTACVLGTWNTYHPEDLLDYEPDDEAHGDVAEWLGISKESAAVLFGFVPDSILTKFYGTTYPTIFDVIRKLELLE